MDSKNSNSDKRPRKNSSTSLLRAKRSLDDAMTTLRDFPELRAEAASLREKLLNTLVDEERKTGSA